MVLGREDEETARDIQTLQGVEDTERLAFDESVSFNCPFRRPSPVADAFVLPKDGSKDYRLVEGESLGGVEHELSRMTLVSRQVEASRTLRLRLYSHGSRTGR
jgi:hypothetical protein